MLQYRRPGSTITSSPGIVNLLLALLIWRRGASTGAVVLGVGLGLYIMSTGWTALFAPDKGVEDVDVAQVANEHPDEQLGLPPHGEFGRLRVTAVERGYYYLKFSDDVRSALPPGCPVRIAPRYNSGPFFTSVKVLRRFPRNGCAR